jgi:hypothetical protein
VSPSLSDAVRMTRPTAVVTGAFDGRGAEAAVLFCVATSQRPVASDSEGTVS